MSVLVLFVNVTEVNLSKIRMLGHEIIFNSPGSIPFYLSLILGYFLIRYVQYWHDFSEHSDSDIKFIKRVSTRSAKSFVRYAYRQECVSMSSKIKGCRSIYGANDYNEYYGTYSEADTENSDYSKIMNDNDGIIMLYKNNNKDHPDIVRDSKCWYRFVVKVDFVIDNASNVSMTSRIDLPYRKLIGPCLKSGAYTLFKTRWGTEYIIPILICVLAYSSYLDKVSYWLRQLP
jgi:hypothetical protein